MRAVVLLCDARRIPDGKEVDDDAILDELELAPWIAKRGVAVIPVITKADKLAKHERVVTVARLRQLIGAPPVAFSSTTGEGRDRLWSRLLAVLPPEPDLV